MAEILQTMLAARSQNSRGDSAGAVSVRVRVVFEEFEDIFWEEAVARGEEGECAKILTSFHSDCDATKMGTAF